MTPLDLATVIRAHVEHARQHPEDAARALRALAALAEELAPTDGPVKVCSCGAEYDAEGWAALPLVGVTDDGIERLEQRNCTAPHPHRDRCMSTLGIVVGPSTEPSDASGAAPEEPASRRTYATSTAPDAPAEGEPRTRCEGCGGALDQAQISRGAKTCSPACRARASRERRRDARLAGIDAAVATLLDLRRDVERA